MTRDALAQDTFNMATIEQVSPARSTPLSSPVNTNTTWSKKDSPQPSKTQWNTKDLGLRLGVDVASAAAAGALTCPLITIIDRAIIEKASKGFPIQNTIKSCLTSMIAKPSSFFLGTPFLLIYTLYSSTYLTANAIDTLSSTYRNQSYDTVTPGPLKFISTTTVNMAICVYKDARFARIFGAQQKPQPQPQSQTQQIQSRYPFPKHSKYTPNPQPTPTATATATSAPKIPLTSYTLFCLRDSVTIFASFNVPPLIAPAIPDFVASTPAMKAAVAQFACPALMQFFSTPMHLLGLDLYNRQPVGGLSAADRIGRIRRDYIPSSFARMGKIVPAYGVGGVINVRMRAVLMGKLEGKN